MSLSGHVACEYMLMISLYKVIGRIGIMTLHLGVLNGEIGTKYRAWDRLRDVSAMISCSGGSGGGICSRLCVYAFVDVWIVVYDVGGCHMSVVIDPGRDLVILRLCMDFVVFLVYFRDNNQNIITVKELLFTLFSLIVCIILCYGKLHSM